MYKRKDTVVGRPDIQKFSGVVDAPGANKGIFLTTSSFIKEAREYTKNINNKKIVLTDENQLDKYMIDVNGEVSL
ncbi:restriction endonuclease [Paraclostridium sordellii]|uniref:restriction endonuclease n=1 Tax=Paraclostridium sordellii TaxID=1505 RepID=UPI003A87240A